YFDEDNEKKDDANDDKSIDLEMTDDEETDDEFVHRDEKVNDNEDEEMKNAKVEYFGKGDAKISDVAKADVEKIEEIKVGTVKDTTDAEINLLLDIKIQSEVLHIQPSSVLTILVSVIFEPEVPRPMPETPLVAPLATLLPPPSVSAITHVPHQPKVPIPTPPIITEAPTITTIVPESNALTDVQLIVPKLEKDRHTTDLIHKYSMKIAPESSKIQKPTIDLEQEFEKSNDQKSALSSQKRSLPNVAHKNKSFNKNLVNHALYHALMKALIEDENVMDKGVVDTVKNHKIQHDDDDDDDDEDPSARPNQGRKTKRRRTKESESSKKPSTTKETSKGKAPSKSSKTGNSATAKEPVEEPINEVVMDDAVNTAGESAVHDDDQPQDTLEPMTDKTLNQYWFKQPPRPLTPDLEWNKRQVVLNQPEQPWFNQMVSTTNDPLTFNDLMATPIDFSNYVLNQIEI
ncbi:hypothetical protein Tco_1471160, partial [Tanacetum coccineum]